VPGKPRLLLIPVPKERPVAAERALAWEGCDVLEWPDEEGRGFGGLSGAPDLTVIDAREPSHELSSLCHRLRAAPVTAASPILLLLDGETRPGESGPPPVVDLQLVAPTRSTLRSAVRLLLRVGPTESAGAAASEPARDPFSSTGPLSLVLEAIGLGTFEYAPASGRLTFSDEARRHLGILPGVTPDVASFMGAVHPADRPRVEAALDEAMQAEGGGLYRVEHRTAAHRDGAERWVSALGHVFFDEHRRPVRLVGGTLDVTDRKRAEDALRLAHHRLQTTIDSITDGLLVLDREWRVTYFSRTGARMIGVRAEDLVGRQTAELFPGAGGKFVESFHRAMASGEPVHFEEHYAPLNLWLECHYYPSGDGLSVYFRDVTDRKKVEEAVRDSESRFRELADSMPQLVWTARPDGSVDYYNERAREFAGLEREADGTWRWTPVVHPDDVERTHRAWQHAVETGETYQIEHRVRRDDGSWRWFLSRAVPVRHREGTILRWYGTATDIQDQKSTQAALQEVDRRKNEFLAILSHELRNPLAPIRNCVYVLKHAAPGGPQAVHAADVIERQTRQLTRLVDDLLEVTRIARGKIELRREVLDLAALARRCAEDHRHAFAASGVDLAVETAPLPLLVNGDPARLAQVIGNLLTNAAKFTSRGGHARLAVREANGRATVMVADDGVGMSPQLVDHLFEPFVQAEATLDRSRGGLGLGLAILKGLVDLHGGSVAARSAGPGTGAEFTVSLALHPAAAVETRGEERRPAPRTGRRILVIEDNADAAESLKAALELLGHSVDLAASGLEGIERAHALRPDLVLCDIGLPDMDGFEVARLLRADPSLSCTKLVAVSGYALPEDLERSSQAGFDRHVAKPVDPEDLAGI
jgi:PAS domain S-box-containing protein